MSSRDGLPRSTTAGANKGGRERASASNARERVSASKARERVLLVCAGLIILFAPSDVYTLGHFSWGPLIVRLEWAGSVLVTVLALRKVEAHGVPIVLNALAILSTVLYGALAWLTGGTSSPLFHWILALPIVIAVVLPDLPGAAVGCGAVLVVYGGLLLGWAGEPLAGLVRWMAQAVVVTSLVYTVSATYRRARGGGAPPPGAPDVGAPPPPAAPAGRPPPGAQDVAAARVRASEAAVAARDEFLAVAAHELRTPLTSMLLHIEAIERTLPVENAPEKTMHVPPTEQKRIAAVARQARRLSGLIDSMLDVSKLTGGHLSLELAEFDVTALVREVALRFTPDATAAACKMTLHLDNRITGVLDANRLDQIITNLIGNALKYGAGSPVEIAVEGDEQVIRLTVRDHGIGISPVDQERIF